MRPNRNGNFCLYVSGMGATNLLESLSFSGPRRFYSPGFVLRVVVRKQHLDYFKRNERKKTVGNYEAANDE